MKTIQTEDIKKVFENETIIMNLTKSFFQIVHVSNYL